MRGMQCPQCEHQGNETVSQIIEELHAEDVEEVGKSRAQSWWMFISFWTILEIYPCPLRGCCAATGQQVGELSLLDLPLGLQFF